MKLPSPPLLLITDQSQVHGPLVDVVASAFEGGCRWVMLREKNIGAESCQKLLSDILRQAKPFDAVVTINADVKAANLENVAGIHLPQEKYDFPSLRLQFGQESLIGVSVHNSIEGEAAIGADYVTVSPVFNTASKPGYGPVIGVKGFKEIAHSLPMPALALGGIEPSNVAQLRNGGAAGFAVMGSVMRAQNPAQKVNDLVSAWYS